MTRLIGVAGRKQHGKDTFGRFLVEDHGFVRKAYADKLRAALYALNPIIVRDVSHIMKPDHLRLQDVVDHQGWEHAKTFPEIRALLQRMGTDACRVHLGQDVWVKALMADIDAADHYPTHGRPLYVITDLRFPNEADAIRERGGIVVQMRRPSAGPPPADEHISESALDGYDFDYIIINDTLEGLRESATAIAL